VKPSQVKLKRNVELAQARQQRLDYSVKTVGYLQAEGETNIAAGVTGVVDEVLFREGQWVPRGAILVKVDQRRYLAAVELARANWKRAEENRELAEKLEGIAKKSGTAISAEEHTKALQALRVALAELSAAQAALDLAENNLYRSQVRAPYAGQMNQRMVTRGTYLEEKTVIGTIADLSRLRLVGSVPEKAGPMVRELKNQREAVRIASETLHAGSLLGVSAWPGFTGLMLHEVEPSLLGYEVQFTLGAFPGRTFYARVFYLSTQASSDTHMFECKGDVDVRGRTLRPSAGARGLAGVRIVSLTDVVADQLDLPRSQGQIVEQVERSSAAAGAGLKSNDILLELNGKPVPSLLLEFNKLLQTFKAGSPVEAVVLRKGRKLTIPALQLAESEPDDASVELKPGYFAEIQFPLKGKPNACFIPEESVRASEQGMIAFVPEMRVNSKGEEEWQARQIRLNVGFRSPGFVEVLDGLEPGDWVVNKGAESLEAGTPLNIPEWQVRELKPARKP
jgi:RND family efflux transporter MFP subunit